MDNSELKDDVNEEDINQQTLLHLAALVGNQKCLVIKILLQTKPRDFTIIRFADPSHISTYVFLEEVIDWCFVVCYISLAVVRMFELCLFILAVPAIQGGSCE